MALTPDFYLRFASIVLLNLALSGDNVVVIGMAAASLPGRQRRAAILGGGVLAIALRILLSLVALALLQVPLLDAVGGALLLWIAWRLLAVDTEGEGGSVASPAGLRQAIFLIVLADLTMSVDNVIAVAGTANGDLFLLVIGLLISMPILIAAGGFVSLLIDRFRWLAYLGAAVIAFTGGRMVLESAPVAATLGLGASTVLMISLALGVVLPASYRLLHLERREDAAER